MHSEMYIVYNDLRLYLCHFIHADGSPWIHRAVDTVVLWRMNRVTPCNTIGHLVQCCGDDPLVAKKVAFLPAGRKTRKTRKTRSHVHGHEAGTISDLAENLRCGKNAGRCWRGLSCCAQKIFSMNSESFRSFRKLCCGSAPNACATVHTWAWERSFTSFFFG